MKRAIALSLLASCCLASAAAPDESRSNVECKVEAGAVESSQMAGEGFAGCNPLDRYYSVLPLQNPASREWASVLQCAQKQDSHAVLMMLYANGFGVKRDSAKAIWHSCQLSAAPAENRGWVSELRQRSQNPEEFDQPFDVCGQATSGYMMGVCSAIQENQLTLKRNKVLAERTRKFSPAQLAAYKTLHQAVDTFAELRSRGEVDLSGSGRVAFIIEERAAILNQFLGDLDDVSDGRKPRGEGAGLRQVDASLNAVYAELMKAEEAEDRFGGIGYTTITHDGIRSAQRAWLGYREAWVKFGAAYKPGVPEDAWREFLTARRTEQLKELLPQARE